MWRLNFKCFHSFSFVSFLCFRQLDGRITKKKKMSTKKAARILKNSTFNWRLLIFIVTWNFLFILPFLKRFGYIARHAPSVHFSTIQTMRYYRFLLFLLILCCSRSIRAFFSCLRVPRLARVIQIVFYKTWNINIKNEQAKISSLLCKVLLCSYLKLQTKQIEMLNAHKISTKNHYIRFSKHKLVTFIQVEGTKAPQEEWDREKINTKNENRDNITRLWNR